jgi:4-hydroxy-3-methylbut-2-enyl diphosphate reductase IspH
MYPESLSEGDIPPEENSFMPPVFDVTSDDYSVSDGDSLVTENTGPSRQSRAPLQTEGVTPAEPTISAGTSQRGRVRTLSRRMAESIAQGLDHVAHESTMGETVEDLFHDSHLELQERMRNPIAFHAEMMGDIMYLQQALRQSDVKEFVQAVIKEVNGHVDSNNWTLKK